MSTNPFAAQIPVGTRVSWTREMYRVPFANRPLDRGVVIEHQPPRGDFVRVRRDGDGQIVMGPAAGFHRERS